MASHCSEMLPNTMKALKVVSKGPAEEVLKYEDAPVPKLTRPNELLVHVKAAGVNPVEAKLRAGNIPFAPLKIPSIIGGDFAGIVINKGEQVTDFQIGDEVYGAMAFPWGPQGTYAEYVILTMGKDAIAKKPDHMSFEEAAGAGIACLTAYQGVVVLGKLPKTESKKLLVIGASGGVGTFAVQIGKALGGHVTGICSSRNVELVASLGADSVVDYTSKEAMDDLVRTQKNTYDVILDCVGGDSYYNQLVGLLKKKGVYATAVGPVQHIGSSRLRLFDMLRMGLTVGARKLFGSRTYAMVVVLPWSRFYTDVHPLLENKSVKTIVPEDQIFELQDGAKAHLKIETHRTVGKIVLRVS